ncbi:hypothetical protein AADG42_13950 [Ammonicoccus fulvus]|uniref:Uncharacterized protein n=1 Tax=Ammonicoccus fulvus TaxID=3138240 RepID=A0ABZ3FU69_9ACTN
MDIVHVDCNRCVARGSGCSDCVISVLLGIPEGEVTRGVELEGDERAALAVLAESGLLPPLRLVQAVSPPEPESFLWAEGGFAE